MITVDHTAPAVIATRAGEALFTCHLPGPYGSVAFRAAYDAAIDGAKAPNPGKTPQGTLGWLIEQYLARPKYRTCRKAASAAFGATWIGCALSQAICPMRS